VRVGILTTGYFPEKLGIGRLTDELSLSLAERGHDVHVATAMPHYPTFEIAPEYRGRFTTTESRGPNLTVHRSYVYVRRRPNFLAKVAFYASFTLSSLVNILRMPLPDAVLVFSPPPTLCFSAMALRLRGRVPIVLDLQDLVPDAAVTLGLTKNPIQIALLKLIEKLAYAISSHIIVVAPSFISNLVAKGVAADCMTLIPNWVNTDLIRPVSRRQESRIQLGITETEFLVTYAGNMGMSQGLEIVLDAAAMMTDHDDVVFLMVGSGTTSDTLRARADDLHLSNVRFLQPQPDYAELQAAADVSLVTQRANILEVNFPSKIAAIMSSGRPMVAALNSGSDAYRIVAEAGCAIFVEPGNPDQLSDAIRKLRSSPQLCAQLGEQGRDYAVRHFSMRSAVDAYERCLEAVTTRRSGARHDGRTGSN